MFTRLISRGAIALACFCTLPAFAEDAGAGDPAKGEALFARRCVSCHVIKDDEGNKIAGRNARTGPNLYAIMGRAPAQVEKFRYGKAHKALGESGVIWDEKGIAAFLQDPSRYLKETLNDPKARSKMSFRVKKEAEAADLAAYLSSVSPAAGKDDASDAAPDTKGQN